MHSTCCKVQRCLYAWQDASTLLLHPGLHLAVLSSLCHALAARFLLPVCYFLC